MPESANNLLLERGVITSVSEKNIKVLCRSKIDCKRCEEGRGCGGGILARWLGERQHSLNITYSPENFNPKIEQIAEFSLPANTIVKIASITYGLPLFLLAMVFLFTSSMSLNELQNILLGSFVLISGFSVARKLVKAMMQRGLLMPNLLRILKPKNEHSCSIETIGVRDER